MAYWNFCNNCNYVSATDNIIWYGKKKMLRFVLNVEKTITASGAMPLTQVTWNDINPHATDLDSYKLLTK